MNDPKTFIHRVAQLRNLIAKPELNGRFVIVESFNAGKERFGVRMLVAPNDASAVPLTLSVKSSSLKIILVTSFAARFPSAEVVEGSILVNVEVTDGDGTVEFEDINFDSVLESDGLCVIDAKHVAFRRCRFHGKVIGVLVGDQQELCEATFESCVFEGNSKGDLAILENAHVKMINCVLHGSTLCVDVLGESCCTAIHCRFHGQVQVQDKASLLELMNCSVIDSANLGIHIANGATALLKGCRMMRCEGEGVMVKGGKRTTVHIEDCVVAECKFGYCIDVGKVNVTLVNSQAFNNAYHGLHLYTSLIGSVTVDNCTFTGNRGVMDVVKMCGPDCAVTIDGVLQPPQFNRDTFERVRVDQMKLIQANHETNRSCRASLQLRRAEKSIGLDCSDDLCCLNCNTLEPIEAKFKACGKCNEVIYCSRECQVAHWKEHKKECGKVKYG